MGERLTTIIDRARTRRWLHIVVIVMRMLLGFAFLPAGLKKLLAEPFTDPSNVGTFHVFLHGFHDTGVFYRFVGALQLIAAVLLLTQRFASLGALLLTPILVAILVFCWSTGVIPTASVVTLMTFGLGLLLLWDIHRWRALFARPGETVQIALPTPHPSIDMRLWTMCGAAILVLYLVSTALAGEVYRPRGADWSNPSFVVLQVIAVLPIITFIVDYRRRHRTAERQTADQSKNSAKS
jgi:uncharacterized membrane protein YphA (DoxX/SURF4 family)